MSIDVIRVGTIKLVLIIVHVCISSKIDVNNFHSSRDNKMAIIV